MKNIKNWTILVLTIFVIFLAGALKWTDTRRKAEKADKERWQNDYDEAIKQNGLLSFTHAEFKKRMGDSTKKLLDSINVRPREVIRYIRVGINQRERDTISLNVKRIYVGGIKPAVTSWKISDYGPCFNWEGIAILVSPDSLNVKRTSFNYGNEIPMVYSKRIKKEFLFMRFYEKGRIDIHVTAKCGVPFSQTIEIIKKE